LQISSKHKGHDPEKKKWVSAHKKKDQTCVNREGVCKTVCPFSVPEMCARWKQKGGWYKEVEEVYSEVEKVVGEGV
jgi:hypothetical protein